MIEVESVVRMASDGTWAVVTADNGDGTYQVRQLQKGGANQTATVSGSEIVQTRKRLPPDRADAWLDGQKRAMERGIKAKPDIPLSAQYKSGDRIKNPDGPGWIIVESVNDQARRVIGRHEKTNAPLVLTMGG